MLEINLKQLESFVATVEHSGFTAAAAALYLTQSTVSAHVSALEQTLGVPLLVRGARRPVTLTPEGQNVYAQAREILNRCERLQALGPAEQPPLRLGASTAPGQGLLPELLTGFLQRCPDSRYVLLRGDSARIHSLMLDSRVHTSALSARPWTRGALSITRSQTTASCSSRRTASPIPRSSGRVFPARRF